MEDKGAYIHVIDINLNNYTDAGKKTLQTVYGLREWYKGAQNKRREENLWERGGSVFPKYPPPGWEWNKKHTAMVPCVGEGKMRARILKWWDSGTKAQEIYEYCQERGIRRPNGKPYAKNLIPKLAALERELNELRQTHFKGKKVSNVHLSKEWFIQYYRTGKSASTHAEQHIERRRRSLETDGVI